MGKMETNRNAMTSLKCMAPVVTLPRHYPCFAMSTRQIARCSHAVRMHRLACASDMHFVALIVYCGVHCTPFLQAEKRCLQGEEYTVLTITTNSKQ